MKYLSILIFLLFNCSLEDKDDEYVNKSILLKGNSRTVIKELTDSVIDFILEKDGDVYMDISDFPLNDKGGYYSVDLKLLTSSGYRFTKFNIRRTDKIIYILDEINENNVNGFNIKNIDEQSNKISVYLKKVDSIKFDQLNIEEKPLEIVLDNSSTLGYVDLTFKVSSNIPNAEFNVSMFSVYWKLGATLSQNGVFDMDTGKEFDPLNKGDEKPWGKGFFRVETTNLKGDVVSVTGTSTEWNNKHIHLKL